jgi:hypothetical protein
VDGPVVDEHAIGIDLGCVYGGRLCAVIFEDDRWVDTMMVEAAERYANPRDVGH